MFLLNDRVLKYNTALAQKLWTTGRMKVFMSVMRGNADEKQSRNGHLNQTHNKVFPGAERFGACVKKFSVQTYNLCKSFFVAVEIFCVRVLCNSEFSLVDSAWTGNSEDLGE